MEYKNVHINNDEQYQELEKRFNERRKEMPDVLSMHVLTDLLMEGWYDAKTIKRGVERLVDRTDYCKEERCSCGRPYGTQNLMNWLYALACPPVLVQRRITKADLKIIEAKSDAIGESLSKGIHEDFDRRMRKIRREQARELYKNTSTNSDKKLPQPSGAHPSKRIGFFIARIKDGSEKIIPVAEYRQQTGDYKHTDKYLAKQVMTQEGYSHVYVLYINPKSRKTQNI